MKCPNCQYENIEGAKFCEQCGTRLAAVQSQEQPLLNPAQAGQSSAQNPAKPLQQDLDMPSSQVSSQSMEDNTAVQSAQYNTQNQNAQASSISLQQTSQSTTQQSQSSMQANFQQSSSSQQTLSSANNIGRNYQNSGSANVSGNMQQPDGQQELQNSSQANTGRNYQQASQSTMQQSQSSMQANSHQSSSSQQTFSSANNIGRNYQNSSSSNMNGDMQQPGGQQTSQNSSQANTGRNYQQTAMKDSYSSQNSQNRVSQEYLQEQAAAAEAIYHQKMRQCPFCGNMIPENAQYCEYCARKLPARETIFCPNCHAAVDPGSKFCEVCGTPLQTNSTMTHPAPSGTEKPKKKSNTWMWVVIVLLVACIGSAAGFIFYQKSSESSSSDSVAVDIESTIEDADKEYIAINDVQTYRGPFSSKTADETYSSGDQIYIVKTASSEESDAIWGKDENGYWLELSDDTVADTDTLDSLSLTSVNKEYTISSSVDVYPYPSDNAQAISSLSKSDGNVTVKSKTEIDGTVWGNIETNQWIKISSGSTAYIEEAPEAVDGYLPGTYKVLTNMKIRSGAGQNYSQVGSQKEGTTVKIAVLKKVSSYDAVWGEIGSEGSGKWICIKNNEYGSAWPEFLTRTGD